MSDATRDGNRVTSLVGSSNAADRAPVDIYADPSTHRLLVNATITGGTAGQQYADGDARGTATGTLAMGDDGTNIQSVHVDTSGDLQIDVLTSALPSGAATAALQTQPGVDIGDVTVNNASGGSAVNVQDGGNSITVDYATTGSGTATGALRVELPTNGTGVIATVGAVTAITNALPAGTNAIGKLVANSGVDIGDVDVTSIAAGTNNIGQVSVAPQTANGLSVFNATSSDGATALTSTAQVIKASAGQLYGWYIYNPNATAQFVQLYNTAAASVTVGTTNPLFMLTIPATAGANVEFTNGIAFSNAGWSCAATSTAGGNGAPSTALDAVFFYK